MGKNPENISPFYLFYAHFIINAPFLAFILKFIDIF